jgi:methionyl-tRNA formyltransferase
MKYIFFGTPRFAEIVLEELLAKQLPPALIVCNPDRPVGRKHIVTPPPTKVLAEKMHIPVLQPDKFDDTILKTLRDLDADCFVVAAYAKIIPRHILEIPRHGALGIHPSLLPSYRGASPIQTTILSNDAKAGVTIYLMDDRIDHGPILANRLLSFDKPAFELTYPDLEEKLARESADLLAITFPEFIAGTIKPKLQDESDATYTQKFTTEDSFVDPLDLAAAEAGDQEKAKEIMRQINALNPEPGVWTHRDEKRVKLLAAKIEKDRLFLTKIQEEGQTPKTL